MDECKHCNELTQQIAQQIAWFSFSLGELSALACQYGADPKDVQAIVDKAFLGTGKPMPEGAVEVPTPPELTEPKADTALAGDE